MCDANALPINTPEDDIVVSSSYTPSNNASNELHPGMITIATLTTNTAQEPKSITPDAFLYRSSPRTSSPPQQVYQCGSILPCKNSYVQPPSWFDALRIGLLKHCFEQPCMQLQKQEDNERDMDQFMLSLKSPAQLTSYQRKMLRHLLKNIQTWWRSSYPTMLSICDENWRNRGLNALSAHPVQFPLVLQKQMTTLVNGIMELIRLPVLTSPTPTASESEQSISLQRPLAVINPKQHLREWLFKHFEHPYPTSEEKQRLSEVTGMTISQVSNWFINARVRTWKPLVMKLGTELKEAQGAIISNNGFSNRNEISLGKGMAAMMMTGDCCVNPFGSIAAVRPPSSASQSTLSSLFDDHEAFPMLQQNDIPQITKPLLHPSTTIDNNSSKASIKHS